MKTNQLDAGKLLQELTKLENILKLSEKRKKVSELAKISSDSKLWEDQEKAKGIMQELSDLTKELDEVDWLRESLKNPKKEDILGIKKRLEKLKITSLLSDLYDNKSAIVGIHAGQGGTEAMDWVSMLYRMYLKYCEKRDWQTTTLELSEGEEAGIKSVTFKVTGNYAYGYLKAEAGTHRLVRQSPFNADKLRQTSFALVEVMPELEEVDLPDIEIKDDDLDWQFFRASAHGGQNVQKVSTAVRLKHKPSGITVTSQVERKQEQNRNIALNLLRARLWLLKKEEVKAEKRKIKGEYRPASWGTQIRSYVLHPYKMVKDLRTQVETKDTESVLDGNLDLFIEQELKLGKL